MIARIKSETMSLISGFPNQDMGDAEEETGSTVENQRQRRTEMEAKRNCFRFHRAIVFLLPLGQFVLTRTRRPWQQAHVPGGAMLLAGVCALLNGQERVAVALATTVSELLALLRLLVVAVPELNQGVFEFVTRLLEDHSILH